jgi:hypothetical protein
MPAHRVLFALCLCLLSVSSLRRILAQGDSTLTGYVEGPVADRRLPVDGRSVLLSQKTTYDCDTVQLAYQIKNGLPEYPFGTRVEVYGKWDKTLSVLRARTVCAVGVLPSHASGEGVLDAITTQGSETVWLVDGSYLHLPAQGVAQQKMIRFKSEAAPGNNAAKPGDWVAFTGNRGSDGRVFLQTATVSPSIQSDAAERLRRWKPLHLVPPSSGSGGVLQSGRFSPKIRLPYDAEGLARVQRLGESVIPGWEKALAAGDPKKRQFVFYLAVSKQKDCTSFPNAVILVPAKTVADLGDTELAGLLAGCIGEVEEEQTARFATKKAVGEASMYVGIGLLGSAEFVGGAMYTAHINHLIQEENARVAASYLSLTSLPRNADAVAWDKLEGRNGQARLDRQPGTRASFAYQAAYEEVP